MRTQRKTHTTQRFYPVGADSRFFQRKLTVELCQMKINKTYTTRTIEFGGTRRTPFVKTEHVKEIEG